MDVRKSDGRYEDAFAECLNYFNGDDLAANVFLSKYALKNDDGTYRELTPDDMHHRMAKEFARIEKKFGGEKQLSEDEIYNLFKNFKYIVPGGSVMSSLGNNNVHASLSNCFVIGQPEDSYGSIMVYRDYQVELMKRRGGVGVDLSKLRPSDTKVNNAALKSTGPVSFMEVNSEITKEVAQGGRRGALMISINGNHPDVEDFIVKKQDLTKCTGANISVQFTDEFMTSVINKQDFVLRWPVDCNISDMNVEELPIGQKVWLSDNRCLKRVHANDIWKQFVHCSWNTAEPGIMYLNKHWNLSPDGVYSQYKGVTTNPCVVGDTLVAVADGRNAVSIKELADEGKDVPVYCLNDEGKITISTMRRPRYTGNKEICKITLENGHEVKCTLNHKFLVNNKGYVEAKDLTVGDSLFLMNKYQCNWKDIYGSTTSRKSTDYYFINSSNENKLIGEHRLIYEHNNNDKPQVVHHKNFNGLDNCVDNLVGMTAKEHNEYHSNRMKGDNNPIFKIKSDEEKFLAYSRKMSESTRGAKNGNAKTVTNEEVILHGTLLVKELGRMFSQKEWQYYAKENNLPMTINNEFRKELGGSIKEFSSKCAELCGIEYPNSDVRQYEFYLKVKEQYPDAFINDGEIYITKKCEHCGKEFVTKYSNRERAYCSRECSMSVLNSEDNTRRRIEKSVMGHRTIMLNIRQKQIDLYRKLNNTKPSITLKEFATECKKANLSCRFGTKNGFKNYNELKTAAESYNHKIICIEYLGNEDVYNGTVDKYHNFFVGGFEEISHFGKPKMLFLNNLQCGEIFMGAGDSCRLMHINLSSFVKNPYKYRETIEEHNDGKVTTKIQHNIPTFDFEALEDVAYKNMRLCDDLVELELEHVQDIIKHIESTYIEDNRNELELWKKIYETGRSSRRAGCGATGLGDAIAMLGCKMNEAEGFKLEEKIFKTKMLGELKAQVDLAKERGTFAEYDFEKEWFNHGENEFFDRLEKNFNDCSAWNEIKDGFKEYGRRNVSWSTMAPVGTGAIMCQGTSGVEPLFSPFYKRRKKVMTTKDRVDFIDANGEKFSEFFVVHKPFKEWIVKNGKYGNFDYDITKTFDEQVTEDKLDKWFKESPWYGSTAPELTPSEHIKSQSIVQKYTTHSISKTINLPNSATEDEISDLFIDGWKQNLKGLTIYRDGCRDGVLITSNDNKKCKCVENLTHDAPKRPKTLPCDIKRFKNGGEEWIACVGLYNGLPYEIFTGKSEKLKLPKYVDTAEIIKNKINKEIFNDEIGENEVVKVSRYDIKYINNRQEEVIIEGLNAVFNPEFYNYSKLISAILRHGMPIEYVVSTIKSLDFKNNTINTWKNGVIRSLKGYLRDGETGEICPECGGKLVRINGCISCPDCGWSKCG